MTESERISSSCLKEMTLTFGYSVHTTFNTLRN